MSVLRHSSLVLRRMACRPRAYRYRSFTTISPHMPHTVQEQTMQSVAPHSGSSVSSAFTMAVALVGLSFSTYSTHQLIMNSGTTKSLATKEN